MIAPPEATLPEATAPQAVTAPRPRGRGRGRSLPRTMAGLLRLYAPRPLRTDDDHAQAVELVDQLMQAPRPTRDQRDYADVLVTLIEAYEREHHGAAEDDLAGVDLLRAVMDEAGLTAAAVADLLGVAPSLVSMILKGERSLTWAHAKSLGARFALPPAAFMD